MFAYSMAEFARGPVRLLTQAFTALAAQVLQLSKLTTPTPALNLMHQQEANQSNVQTLFNSAMSRPNVASECTMRPARQRSG